MYKRAAGVSQGATGVKFWRQIVGPPMSNVLRDQCRFFTLPRAFLEAGHLRELSPCAKDLYLVLFALAQKHSAVEIQLPGYELRDYTGLTDKSATKAGRQLEEAGLVGLKKGRSGVMTYLLLNPETAEPLPAPEGRRGVRKHDPKPERSARSARKAIVEAAVREPVARPSKPELVNLWDGPEPEVLRIATIQGPEVLRSMTANITEHDRKYSEPCAQKQQKTGELEGKPLSESISEGRVSEQRNKPSEQQWNPQGNPKGFECYLHGKVDFEGPFCLLCHPSRF
jgi:hypothetical protein